MVSSFPRWSSPDRASAERGAAEGGRGGPSRAEMMAMDYHALCGNEYKKRQSDFPTLLPFSPLCSRLASSG